MKVLLKEDVDNLGYAGEVMEVADGYGRNYLIPKGLAVKATKGVLNQAQSWRERATVRMAELRKEHQALAERIDATTLHFTARAGETGKLYGSVTTADVCEQLNEVLGTEIDRRQVISEPLRQLGEHNVTIRLSRDYSPQVTVLVHAYSDEAEVEEEIEAEIEEAVLEEAVEELAEIEEFEEAELEMEFADEFAEEAGEEA